jgi:hypothetical protein
VSCAKFLVFLSSLCVFLSQYMGCDRRAHAWSTIAMCETRCTRYTHMHTYRTTPRARYLYTLHGQHTPGAMRACILKARDIIDVSGSRQARSTISRCRSSSVHPQRGCGSWTSYLRPAEESLRGRSRSCSNFHFSMTSGRAFLLTSVSTGSMR